MKKRRSVSIEGAGIPDWIAKRDLIKTLLGRFTWSDVIDSFTREAQEAEKLKDASRRWSTSLPSYLYEPFINRVLEALDAGPRGKTAFRDESILQFVEELPDHHKETALKHLRATAQRVVPINKPPGGSSTQLSGIEGSYFPLMMSRATPYLVSDELIKNGRVEQSICYLTPDSAHVWQALVDAQEYPTYDHCKGSLVSLLESDCWNSLVGAGAYLRIVVLGGGGSPSKDMVFINNLVKHTAATGAKLTYTITDISPFMIAQSRVMLDGLLARIKRDANVRIETICDNFLTWPGPGPHEGNTIWAITGGTIGNVSERRFFRSINRIAKSGDLLVVSAATTDGISDQDLTRDLQKTYSHDAMRRFVEPPLKVVLNTRSIDESVNSALKRVKAEIVDAHALELSHVEGGRAVTLNIQFGDDNYTLLSSTRYPRQNLINYAGRFFWEHISTVESPANKNFVQLLLRKLPSSETQPAS